MNGLQRAEHEAERWIRVAGDACEKAARIVADPTATDHAQRQARATARYWSGVAFIESKRLARLRAGDNQQGIKA